MHENKNLLTIESCNVSEMNFIKDFTDIKIEVHFRLINDIKIYFLNGKLQIVLCFSMVINE